MPYGFTTLPPPKGTSPVSRLVTNAGFSSLFTITSLCPDEVELDNDIDFDTASTQTKNGKHPRVKTEQLMARARITLGHISCLFPGRPVTALFLPPPSPPRALPQHPGRCGTLRVGEVERRSHSHEPDPPHTRTACHRMSLSRSGIRLLQLVKTSCSHAKRCV